MPVYCGKCGAVQVVVPYIPLRKPGTRHYYLACSRCDLVPFWPVFNTSTPPVPREAP